MNFAEYHRWTRCEALAHARHVVGDYQEPETRSQLVGAYVHALLTGGGALESFVAGRAAALLTQAGRKRAAARRAEAMAAALRSDPLCASCLAGERDVAFRGELGGLEWELSVDALNVGAGLFTDVVTSRSLDHAAWSPAHRARVPFWELHGYWTKLAVMSHVLRQGLGRDLEPLLVVVSDEPVPGKMVLSFANPARLGRELAAVQWRTQRIAALKAGKIPPRPCGVCDYCKERRPLAGIAPASSQAPP